MQNPDILLKIETEIKEKTDLKKQEGRQDISGMQIEKSAVDKDIITKELGRKESLKKQKSSSKKIVSDIMGEVELEEEGDLV